MFLSAGTILGSFLSFFLQIFHMAAAVSSCLKNKMKPLSDFLSGHLRNLIAHPVVLVLPCPFSHVFLFSSIATVPALVPALGPPVPTTIGRENGVRKAAPPRSLAGLHLVPGSVTSYPRGPRQSTCPAQECWSFTPRPRWFSLPRTVSVRIGGKHTKCLNHSGRK